jgi:DNA-binding GntR family transcriptional regulator
VERLVDTFEPGLVPRQPLWEPIAASLRRAILLGELPAGLHLEEPGLAEKFGVSRIPVREAFTRLAHEGLIRLEPHRGAFVVGMTAADVHEVYEFRLLLEAHAVRRAAERVDEPGIAQLQAFVDEMADAVAQSQLHRVSEPDVSFHRQIVVLADNRRLLAAWEPISGIVGTILSITDTTYRDMPRAIAGHQSIVGALAQRDAHAAEQELRRHLENGEAVLGEAMRSTRFSVGAYRAR